MYPSAAGKGSVTGASVLTVVLVLGLGASGAIADTVGATVYGKANVALARFDDDVDRTWELTSNASRLGFKGSADLDGSLKAIYKLEFEVFFDEGESGGNVFKQRNIYVGLQGSGGTLFAGKHDTALKLAQLGIDHLNDLPGGDIKNILIGENRSSNLINYTTPGFSGFSATVQLILNEGEDIFGNGGRADSLTDSISTALQWSGEQATVVLAYDKDVVSSGVVAGLTAAPFATLRLAGEVKLDQFTIGAIFERAEDTWDGVGHSNERSDGYVVSGSWEHGNWTLHGQFARSDMPIRFAMSDRNRQIAVVVDYSLGKNSKIFGYYSGLDWEERLTGAEEEESVLALGFEHKF